MDIALSLSTKLHNATTLGGSQEGGFVNEVLTFQSSLFTSTTKVQAINYEGS